MTLNLMNIHKTRDVFEHIVNILYLNYSMLRYYKTIDSLAANRTIFKPRSVFGPSPSMVFLDQGHFSCPPKSCKTCSITRSKMCLLLSEFALRKHWN